MAGGAGTPSLVGLLLSLLQLALALVVTCLFSLVVPDKGSLPQTHPDGFVVVLRAAFTTGVFLPGRLAPKWR